MRNADSETDKTDETDCLGNWKFLEAVFGAKKSETSPIVVSFDGNPQTVPKKSWFGTPWKPDVPHISAANNNYFSLAVFRPDETGRYRLTHAAH